LLILCVPVILYWSNITQYNSIQPDQKTREAAIVLGTAVWGQEPSPAFQERLEMAYSLYQKKCISFIFLTGGLGKGTLSESEAGKKYLLRRGVPEKNLILETRSTTTKENLQFISTNLKEHHMNLPHL
jgi:vancomycin permeability regulator SanA